MNRSALLLALLLLGAAARADDFACPEGATVSGPFQPGDVVRWCEMRIEGRTVYHGPVWRWYRNGKRRSQESYVEGRAEGEWASWYPNGKQSSLGFFNQGHKTGTWLYWNEAGRVIAEVTYGANGDHWVEYFPRSGKKHAVGDSVVSGKIGQWSEWDKKGKLVARCNFGTGLVEPLSAQCRKIADEVEPIGFSRPLPQVKIDGRDIMLNVQGRSFTFRLPEGWKVRAQRQLPIVLEQETGGTTAAPATLSLRVASKEPRRLTAAATRELTALRENVTRYVEIATRRSVLKGRRPALHLQVNYRPRTEQDSPLSRAAANAVFSQISFLDAADDVLLIAELDCDGTRQLKDLAPALADFISPFNEPPPVVAAPEPPPQPAPEESAPPTPPAPTLPAVLGAD